MLKQLAVCFALVGSVVTHAQTVELPPGIATAFEVTTVKPSAPGVYGSNSNSGHGRYEGTNMLVRGFMEHSAYDIPAARILGMPAWEETTHFDISAKFDPATTEQLSKLTVEQRSYVWQAASQQLLIDRFKLLTHWETRELPVYALVTTAKKGPGLVDTKSPVGSTGSSSHTGNLSVKGASMEQLANILTRVLGEELGRNVLDKTGWDGRYDATLKWTPANADPAQTDGAPSVFTALQEQLGLKLEATKAPMKVLVVDHIEMPQEN